MKIKKFPDKLLEAPLYIQLPLGVRVEMGIAAQESRRNRLLLTLLAVCLLLAAILQLNGRSILALGETQGKEGVFATLVQPDPRGVAGGLAPATGLIGRLLDSAGRSPRDPHPRAMADMPLVGPAASSGILPVSAGAGAPSPLSAAIGSDGDRSGADGVPPFSGLLAQLSPISGPAAFAPTAQPTPPAVEPTPTPTGPVIGPTPPVTEPTGPVSPVPEPAAWALWLLGFGLMGSLTRWRRHALAAVAAKDADGDAA